MLRHDFRPGKLVAGLFLTATGVVYLGDAGDAWHTPWFVVIPLIVGGLCLAGAVAFLNHSIRGRRASGRTGTAGPMGASGMTGMAGASGTTGSMGPTGTAGRDGATEQAGRAGTTGEAARGSD
ncbi:hypothetical protein ACWD26_09150 [Streptomyces sp. NPDC002787]